MATAVAQIVGYVVLSTVMEGVRRGGHGQRGGDTRRGGAQGDEDARWGFPAWRWAAGIGQRPGRHARHALYCTINLLVSAAVAGAVVQRGWDGLGALEGWTVLQWGARPELGLRAAAKAAAAFAWQVAAEWPWHYGMHRVPGLYRAVHKLHHHNKAPVPFDDLFIHPLEALGYYLLLYAPAMGVVGSMPAEAFAAYIAVMGVCGVLDHSGVRVVAPGGAYDSAEHAQHHAKFECNYGFPVAWGDHAAGTYRTPS